MEVAFARGMIPRHVPGMGKNGTGHTFHQQEVSGRAWEWVVEHCGSAFVTANVFL